VGVRRNHANDEPIVRDPNLDGNGQVVTDHLSQGAWLWRSGIKVVQLDPGFVVM
jgi:hypothetical protein